ncbi:MAG: protein kinase [Phycisphaerae bacterium]|nr:protein kinase [Phycisphaerae bacterium]
MSERPLSDFDPEQLRALLSIAQDAEARGSEEGFGVPSRPSPSEPAAQWLGRWIDQYKLVRLLGEGGMAVVYLAEQEHPIKRPVALKIIKPGMDSKRVITRFETERRTLALLNHPNIARIFDAGTTEEGRPYFVMEVVDGPAITEYCDRNKLSIDDRLELFRQVCDAIHYAHQKGIIHRDIKASNVLVTTEEGRPVPKVIDFGVARAISPEFAEYTSVTQAGQLIGTPEYMSPEQVNLASEDIDVRSDIYSLGVLLYVLLTGAMPFDSETLRKGGIDALRRFILEEEPKTPSARLVGLEGLIATSAENRRTETKALTRRLYQELEWIPLKAMAKDRERRYRSAAELADDLHNYLNGAPLIAGPPSRLYKVRKFVRRNRTLVAATALLAFTIVIGTIVTLAMYMRAQVQAQRSQAVSTFLNDSVLRALDPYREQGGEITALSVLNAVSESLEGRFKDAPLLEADVRHRLGRTYEAHAQYDRALQHLQRAWDIRRRELGSQDPLTMETMHRLAWALCCANRPREAEPLLLELVAESPRAFGEEDLRTISAKRMLAWNHMGLGEYGTAIRMFQEVRSTARRALGNDSQLAVLAMTGIGHSNVALGHYDEAERWYREALQSSMRGLGSDHALTRRTTGDLGYVYLLQGRYAEAERALTESIAHESDIFGERHLETTDDVKRLIQLYVRWGKPEEARKWRANLGSAKPADAGNLAGSVQYNETAETYAIRGCGMDIWQMFDEFHFAHKTLQGDGSITARIDSIEDTDPRAKTGVMIRKTPEPTSEHASVFITPASIVAFQYRSTPQGVTSRRYTGRESVKFPHWVRLTRRGNAFTAEHSSDGMSWKEVRSPDPNESGPVEIAMEETVHVGLAVTSRNVDRAATARIAHVTSTGNVTPAGPFTLSEDIGLQTLQLPTGENIRMASADSNGPGVGDSSLRRLRFIDGELCNEDISFLTIRHGGSVGSVRYEQATGTYTVLGSGTDVFNKSDQFHLAWKKFTGDGSIVAKIESVQYVNALAEAGVMIRNSLDPNSQHAMVLVRPTRRVAFLRRVTAGGESQSAITAENAIALPHWVKLTRKGDLFTAQHSKDGVKWQDIEGNPPGDLTSVRISMNPTVYIGLAVTSHAGPIPAEAKMSNVAVTGKVEPPGEFLWSEDIGFQMIMLPKK